MNAGGVDLSSLCPEWGDDVRMTAMFAPLQNKQLNPEAWTAKIAFWSRLLNKYCDSTSTCLVRVADMKLIFQRAGRSPHCLPDVIKEGITQSSIIDANTYLDSLESADTWGGWLLGVGTRAVKTIGKKVVGSSTEVVVVPEQVAKLEKIFFDSLSSCEPYLSLRNAIFVKSTDVHNLLKSCCGDQISFEYLLKVLIAKRKLDTMSIGGTVLYKVASGDDRVSLDEVDEGVVRLKENLLKIEKEMENVETRVSAVKEEAKQHLQNGSRVRAKSCLMRKKTLDSKMDRLTAQLNNLQNILEEILEAESNRNVLTAYKAGLAAMRGMLTPDMSAQAESTMSELSDLLAISGGITDTLAATDGPAGDNIDESELEAELNSILSEGDGQRGSVANCSDSTKEQEMLKVLENLEFNDLEPVIGSPEREKPTAISS